MLYPAITGERGNGYCGPAALVSVFGCTVEFATARIRLVTGKANVHGVYRNDMHYVLVNWPDIDIGLGYDYVGARKSPTLERFAAEHTPGIWIVNITGHYVALDSGSLEVCDNHTIYPLPLARYRRRRAHVKRAWRIR